MDRKVAKNCTCIYISLQIPASNPDALQHNGMTNNEMEIENHTIQRMRLTGSNIFRNYQSTKGNTMQKLTKTCFKWYFVLQIQFVIFFFRMLSIITTTLFYRLYASVVLSLSIYKLYRDREQTEHMQGIVFILQD